MIIDCKKCHKKYVEYPEQLCDSCRADEIETEWHDDGLMQDEMEEISPQEIYEADRLARQERQQYEDSVL